MIEPSQVNLIKLAWFNSIFQLRRIQKGSIESLALNPICLNKRTLSTIILLSSHKCRIFRPSQQPPRFSLNEPNKYLTVINAPIVFRFVTLETNDSNLNEIGISAACDFLYSDSEPESLFMSLQSLSSVALSFSNKWQAAINRKGDKQCVDSYRHNTYSAQKLLGDSRKLIVWF